MKQGKLVWHATRTLTFYLIGVMNTFLIRPEDVGTYKNYIGFALLIIAVIDTVYGVKLWLKQKKDLSA